MPLYLPAYQSTDKFYLAYSAADQTGITGTVDVIGLTGIVPTNLRPNTTLGIYVAIGKQRLTAGTPPLGLFYLLYEDAVLLASIQSPMCPVAHASVGTATLTPPSFTIERTYAQMIGKTYKVQTGLTGAGGTWSIQNTNIASIVRIFEV